jgi:hypothetical protein
MQKIDLKISQVLHLIVFVGKYKNLDLKRFKDFNTASRYVMLMLN